MSQPVNITIETPDADVSVKYQNLKESGEEMRAIANFLADNPNLIDVFRLAADLAEHHLISKLHQQNLIEY